MTNEDKAPPTMREMVRKMGVSCHAMQVTTPRTGASIGTVFQEEARGGTDTPWPHTRWYVFLTRSHTSGVAAILDVGLWRQGTGCKDPKAEDVLASMVRDAYDADERFADWCSTFGYDTDSRKALATYEKLQELAPRVKAWAGWENWEALVTAAHNH